MDRISELVGYDCGSQLKRMVLEDMRKENMSIVEACRKYAAPGPLTFLDDDGSFEFRGKRYTPESWQEAHPCQTLIILKVREPNN